MGLTPVGGSQNSFPEYFNLKVKAKNDHRSKFFNLSNWNDHRTKFSSLQPQFKYMNYFIYTSHHFTPHGRYELNKLASLPMCGFIAQCKITVLGLNSTSDRFKKTALTCQSAFIYVKS